MKKILSIMCVVAVTASVYAAGTAQVNMSMTQTLLWQDALTTTEGGWYVEAILSANNNVYNSALFTTESDYIVIGEDFGTIPGAIPYHQTGKTATGGTINNGRVGMGYQFTSSIYDNYYVTLRFYNGTSKTTASKYGVIPTWKQITVDPNAPTANQNPIWSSVANDKAFIQYNNPLYAVPEPTTMALFGLGGLALVIRRKMRKDA
jgi:hypothetical protein